MKLERFNTPGLAQVAYGIADPSTKQAAVIDPRRDIAPYLAWAARHGYTIVAVLETHVHADFVSGARELAAATGAPIYAGRLGESAFPHVPLDDGDVIDVGNLKLQAFWTPGHTPEHMSFLLIDPALGALPSALFSGDVLFAGEIGRPDLLGEERQDQLIEQLHDTVYNRLARLPDDVIVYPGHGAGSPCGKNIGETDMSTIGREKQFNYAFLAGSKEDFVRSVMAGMPRPPAYYPTMKAVNKHGPTLLRDVPTGAPLNAGEVAALQEQGALVIDARLPEDFAKGHVPGAVSVGLGPNFAIWVGWLTPYDRDVVLVLADDSQYSEALTELHRIGVDRVKGYLRGGIQAWRASGMPLDQLKELSVEDLALRLDDHQSDIRVLDVRDATERAGGHIPGSRNVSAGAIAQGAEVDLDDDAPVAVICGSGYRSMVAASLLQGRGLTNVMSIPGGMGAWTKSGLPVA